MFSDSKVEHGLHTVAGVLVCVNIAMLLQNEFIILHSCNDVDLVIKISSVSPTVGEKKF